MAEEGTRTNPNGSNQHTSDPREQVMWDIYIEGIASGYENAYEAAMKAGYEESSAKNITLRGWFKERVEKLRRREMLSLAEKNLKKGMSESYLDKDGGIRADVMRVVMDVSKTVATTLGKDDGYSTRNENTGKGGGPIQLENITGMQIIKE